MTDTTLSESDLTAREPSDADRILSRLNMILLGQEVTNDLLARITVALENLAGAVNRFKMPSIFGGSGS